MADIETDKIVYNVGRERINDFILSLRSDENKDLLKLKKYAFENDVPIIKDDTRDFLKTLLNIKKPSKILELGTAIAYSTIILYNECAEHLESLVTIENFEKRIVVAKENIDKYLDKNKVKLIEGDIGEYLKQNSEKERFDFIFLDAAKAQYIIWFPYIKKMLNKDGILVADNIFKDGEVIESKWLIEKRDRTIHKRMREFLHTIMRDEQLHTEIFNLGDGISVSIKK